MVPDDDIVFLHIFPAGAKTLSETTNQIAVCTSVMHTAPTPAFEFAPKLNLTTPLNHTYLNTLVAGQRPNLYCATMSLYGADLSYSGVTLIPELQDEQF